MVCPDASFLCPVPVHRASEIPRMFEAIEMVLLHHLGELVGLVQSSYTPEGYSRLLFRFSHCQAVSSLLGFAVMCLASIILVAINVCYSRSSIGFRNKKFLLDGVVSPMHNPPLLPALRTGCVLL